MTVKTLSPQMLVEKSEELAHLVLLSKWTPELVIGIKTGGLYVADPLVNELNKNAVMPVYLTVSLSRPSTQKKKKFNVGKLLKKLPYFMLDILRNIEVYFFEIQKKKYYDPKKEKDIPHDEVLIQQIKKTKNILLVDDAIDTGSTIVAMKNFIHTVNPKAEIKVAVLTTTHKNPYINADYSLYNRVLLRCPWAEDYKGVDNA